MPQTRGWKSFVGVGLGLAVCAIAAAGPPDGNPRAGGRSRSPHSPLQERTLAASVKPKEFGTQDQAIKVVSALDFYGCGFLDPVTLSQSCCEVEDLACFTRHWYAALRLPAGAVIDFIGVNTATTVDGAMGFTLHFRDHLGGTAELASFTFPTHPGGAFGTDYSGQLGIVVPNNVDREYVLDVEVAPGLEELQYFGYVEIWWRRTVSDPPVGATFGDVPTSHPFFQFIEALSASGVTGGCGNGNFCSEAPLTRGQMAVFLAKALGLHWPE